MDLNKLIKEYIDYCTYRSKLDEKTIKAYKIDLEQFYDIVKEKNFCKKEILFEYIYFLNRCDYSIKTQKRKIASIKAFFSFLNFEDKIDDHPFLKIKTKMKEPFILPKVIPLSELEHLFEYLYSQKEEYKKSSYKYKSIVRDIAVLELLFGTGVRISELCNLKEEDVRLRENFIKIFGKGAKERIIPIFDNDLLAALNHYKEIFYEDLSVSDYFFINKRKKGLSDQSVRNMIKKHCKKCEIKLHITPHMFRHTFATTLLELDVDSRHIQQLLGHSNITTTQIYTHITLNKKEDIMKNRNPRKQLLLNKG